MHHQQSQYHLSGSHYGPNITTEGVNTAELFMGPDELEMGQVYSLPKELHVPSQAPSLPQAGFPGMRSSTGFTAHTRSATQPMHFDPQLEYIQGPMAVTRGQDERRFNTNHDSGQATVTAEAHASAAYVPHNPHAGNQGSLNQGQGYYYLDPPTPQWLSQPPAVSFAGPSGRMAPIYQEYHNSVSTTHENIQPRQRQFSSLPSSSTGSSDLQQYFPLDSDEHRKKREALKAVMQSPWKQNNVTEPEASLLLQFMVHDPTDGRWHCTFWKDGRPCDCSCKKRDHAKGHIRSHIDLLPFVCTSRCPYSTTGCAKRYPATEPLQKHRKGKTMCDNCGLAILPSNMKRHVQICHPEV